MKTKKLTYEHFVSKKFSASLRVIFLDCFNSWFLLLLLLFFCLFVLLLEILIYLTHCVPAEIALWFIRWPTSTILNIKQHWLDAFYLNKNTPQLYNTNQLIQTREGLWSCSISRLYEKTQKCWDRNYCFFMIADSESTALHVIFAVMNTT